MRILKMIIGISLFTLGALFHLGLWSNILLVLGGILFFTTLMGKSGDKIKVTKTNSSKREKTIKDKDSKRKSIIKLKGRLAVITFFLLLFLGSYYKFEINQSPYMNEILTLSLVPIVLSLQQFVPYFELIFKGESF